MSLSETLLAAVCLLAACAGIAVMAEGWRDTADTERAAAEFTLTARRAAAWVLSRRAELAQKAEHAPFSLTELCPETASVRNSVTGQPYTVFLFTPDTGKLSLALFASGSGMLDPERLRKIIRPAARRIEAGFAVAGDGLLVRGNEKLSPASLCSGCGSLSSALPAGSWGAILTLPEGRTASAVPADGLVSRLAVPGGEESRMDAALDMNGNAVTDLSALFFSSGNDGPAPGAAAFREACSSGSGEGALAFFRDSGLLFCRGKEAVSLPDSLSSLLLRQASRPDISNSASALRQASAAGTFPASGTGATGSVTCPQGMIPAVWSAAVLLQKKTAVRKTGEEVLGSPPAGYSGNVMRLRVCLHQGE